MDASDLTPWTAAAVRPSRSAIGVPVPGRRTLSGEKALPPAVFLCRVLTAKVARKPSASAPTSSWYRARLRRQRSGRRRSGWRRRGRPRP